MTLKEIIKEHVADPYDADAEYPNGVVDLKKLQTDLEKLIEEVYKTGYQFGIIDGENKIIQSNYRWQQNHKRWLDK